MNDYHKYLFNICFESVICLTYFLKQSYVNNIFPTYAQRTVKNSTYVNRNLY